MLSSNNVYAYLCGYAIVIGIAMPVTVHMLDKATRQQCANHDWPEQAHYVHMDWCKTNGYKTNWSVQAGDQVQTLVQYLPLAEMGTAQPRESYG